MNNPQFVTKSLHENNVATLWNKPEVSKDSVVRARIDNETKEQASEALRAMGLSLSDAVRLLLICVAEVKRLPFIVHVPNPTTLGAMKELDDEKGKRLNNVEQLFRDLDT